MHNVARQRLGENITVGMLADATMAELFSSVLSITYVSSKGF
jgi:hypothetical protein